jgi:hypothetical protein
MTKDNWLSILRSTLTFLGTVLVGHSIMGHTVDTAIWETIGGTAMALAGTVLGIQDKTTGPEQWASLARSVLIGLGGIGVSWGYVSSNTMASISSLVMSILPVILSQLSKKTNKEIATGTVTVSQNGKVLEVAPPVPPPKQP